MATSRTKFHLVVAALLLALGTLILLATFLLFHILSFIIYSEPDSAIADSTR